MIQATIQKDRYKPVKHHKLKIGNIVLLKEPHLKSKSYPLGIVKKVEENALGEVTAARVLKGKSREVVYRHVSFLILLISSKEVEEEDTSQPFELVTQSEEEPKSSRSQRASAIKFKELLKKLVDENLV